MIRRKLAPLALLMVLPLALTLGACGDDDDNGDGGTDAGQTDAGDTDAGDTDAGDTDAGETCEPGAYTFSGVAELFPGSTLVDAAATIEGAEISLQSATGLLGGTPVFLTYGADCADAITTVDATGAFEFTEVDPSGAALGVISVIDDAVDSTEDAFVLTGMGIASLPVTTDVTDVTAFAVPRALEGALAQFTGGAAGDLEADGFIVGLALDATGQPAEGITVLKNGTALDPAAGEVAYPNAVLDGVEADGNTSTNGLFIVPAATLGTYAGSSDGTNADWGSQQAASAPGAAFVLVLMPEA